MLHWRISCAVFGLFLIVVISLSCSNVTASRCQIADVSYSIPQQAAPSQQIKSATSVSGSCGSNGEDYYSVRVDLVDVTSGLIVSSNSTAIGYAATNFTTTVENILTTPSNNGTWFIDINVYVIRAGGTGGSYLLDYKTSSNATIQIGPPTSVPEFPIEESVTVTLAFFAALPLLRRHSRLSATDS